MAAVMEKIPLHGSSDGEDTVVVVREDEIVGHLPHCTADQCACITCMLGAPQLRLLYTMGHHF